MCYTLLGLLHDGDRIQIFQLKDLKVKLYVDLILREYKKPRSLTKFKFANEFERLTIDVANEIHDHLSV